MLTGPALDNLAPSVARACRSGLDADSLRAGVLPRIRKAVPIDALWWAAADPATLLFNQPTGRNCQRIPARTSRRTSSCTRMSISGLTWPVTRLACAP